LRRRVAVHLAPLAAISAHEALDHLPGLAFGVELPAEHLARL
jgi:hypothetical protein